MEIWLKSLSDRMDIGLCCRCRYESDEVLANLSNLRWIYVVIFAENRSIRMNRTSCVASRSCLSLFFIIIIVIIIIYLFIYLLELRDFWNFYFPFVFPWLHVFVSIQPINPKCCPRQIWKFSRKDFIWMNTSFSAVLLFRTWLEYRVSNENINVR